MIIISTAERYRPARFIAPNNPMHRYGPALMIGIRTAEKPHPGL